MIGLFFSDDSKWDCITIDDLWNSLMDFSNKNSSACSDLSMSNDSFTYVSPSHCDHVFSSRCMRLQDVEVLNAHALLNNFSISFLLDIPVVLNRRET